MASDIRSSLQKELHDLPSGWNWEWFTDVMDIEGGTQPPASTFIDSPREGYVRLIQIRDFETDSHLTFIPDSRKWRKCVTNDVLIGRYGAALGRICRGRSGAYNVALAKVIPGGRVDIDFVHHLLRSDYFQGPLLAGGARSAQAGFNKGNLAVIPLPIPPLPEQKAIARILGTLDDKIELNRRMNATLEAMARALFQSWFVDFDPVHANAAGRQPAGMDPQTAALFPDSFQASELGQIPTGWSVQRIEEIAERVAMGPFGSNIKRENFVEAGVPVIRGNNLTDGFVDSDFVYVTETKAKELQNSIAHRGDLVFTHRGTLGQVGLIHEDATFPRYIVSQSQMLLRIRQGTLSPESVYQFFRSPAGQQALLANTSQTGVPAIARPTTSLKAIQIVVPPTDVSSAFERLVAPIRRQISNNTKQSRTLATLRDMLLPKLLSGELSNSESVAQIEQV